MCLILRVSAGEAWKISGGPSWGICRVSRAKTPCRPVETASKRSSVGRQKPAQIRGKHGSSGLGVNSSRLNGIDGAFLPKTAV